MSKRRHNFGTKRFKEKSIFIFHARIALKSLVLLFVRLIARGARIGKTHTHTHTHTHTDRQTDKTSTVTLAHAEGFALLCFSLTLDAHARGLQYSFCLSVCLSVCVSVCLCVCFPYSGTSRNQAYKQQYQRLQRDTGMKYKKGFFFKTLRSEVMASFTHLE